MFARIILFIALVPFVSKAQSKVIYPEQIQNPVWVRVAYMGSMIYPGAVLGLEYPLKTKYYRKGSDSTLITKVKQRSITGNLSWYHHRNYHDHFIFSTGYLMRRTSKKGWFTDFEPQLGISRTFNVGTVYVVDANKVEQKPLGGDWFLATKLSVSIGKDLSYKTSKSIPLKIYARPSFIVLLPYNNFIYVRPMLELGAMYSFNNFWMVKSKRIYVN